ncbi:MAG: hypothetical protein ABJK39_01915 [Hyphomicrobiales bacterium]
MAKDTKVPPIAFFLVASMLLALSTFLWLGIHFFVDKSQESVLLSMETSLHCIAVVLALGALVSIYKGIQQQKKLNL